MPNEKESEKEKISQEIVRRWFSQEREGVLERKELSEAETLEKERLKKELEVKEFPKEREAEVLKEAEEVKRKSAEGKIKHLLDLAQAKGLIFAVETARKTQDPYLLDLFHDILAKESLYKQFG